MKEYKIKISPKGEVIIPKLIRKTNRMYSGQELIISGREDGIFIKKQQD